MIEKWKHTSSLYLSCQCVYLVSYSYRENAAAAITRVEYKNSLFYFRAMIERQNCNEHKNEWKFLLHTFKNFLKLKFKFNLCTFWMLEVGSMHDANGSLADTLYHN